MDAEPTAESLSALMRATWTWDDRALRHELAALLVDLAAARHLAARGDGPVTRLAHAAARTRAAHFVADVLGPRIVADTGEGMFADATELLLGVPALRGGEEGDLDEVAEHVLRTGVGATDSVGAAVRRLAVAHGGEEAVRKAVETGTHDPAVWTALTDDLGLARLAVPAEHGGVEAGPGAQRTALIEQGRALLPSPFWPSAVLAAQALLASGDAVACGRFLPGIAAGSTVATVAVAERGGAWDPVLSRTRALPDGTGWRVTGGKTVVPGAENADLLLVVARTRGGPSLFAVPRGTEGLQVRPLRVLDGTRPIAEVTLHDTPAELVGTAGAAAATVRRTLDLGGLALAAEQVGAARRCVELAADAVTAHAGHALAAVAVQVEAADALVTAAFAVASDPGAEATATAVSAHVLASAALRNAAAEAARCHGEPALAPDHAVQPYLRRAKAAENLLGGPAVTHERLLDRLGI